MADLHEHVAYLSQEIGPRPAGTEEEQRAALYISEQVSKETGLPTSMEDFQCNPDSSLPRALCFGVAAAVTLIATIFSLLAIPAIVISLLCAGLIAAEIFGKPVLSRLMNRGVSQNVVVRYQPPRSTTRAARRRKIILVANYDSGKIRRGLSNSTISILPVLYWAEFAALVLMPLLMLCRTLANAEGTLLLGFNILLGICMVLAVLPILSLVLEKTAEYNEAANCNASGVAVMMEVAARVAEAAAQPEEEGAFIHGEAAAQSAGLAIDGADLVYDVAPSADADANPSMESAAARLAAAKAAVAALSGKPVSSTTNVVAPAQEPADAAAEETAPDADTEDHPEADEVDIDVPAAPVVAVMPEPEPEPVHEVPEWFKRGQEQAKRPAAEAPVRRSRFADALAAAEEEAAAPTRTDPASAAELDARVNAMRESVLEAAEAAGAHKTEAIAPVELDAEPAAEEEAPAEEAAPAEESVVAEVAEEADAPAANGEVPTAAPKADSPSTTSSVPPVIIPASAASLSDDPDVIVREAARPLTGTVTDAGDASPLAHIPSPAAPSAVTGAVPRVVIPAAADAAQTGAVAPAARPARKRRAITLPDIGVSQELPRISMDGAEQAAPLSEDRPARDGRVRDLSAVIPSVSSQASSATQAESALMGAMPSLSHQTDPGLSGSISLAGSFSSMGATGAAEPLGDEFFESASQDDLYVTDVDDSVYQEQVTETGALAGPGYVDMPKSRFGRLFGKIRRKDRDRVSTPQEWLDVEDDFEASQVGAARGGWESFREDDYDELGSTTAFSSDFGAAFDDDDAFDEAPRHGRPFQGGGFRAEEDEDYFSAEDAPAVAANAFGLPADFVFESDTDTAAIEQFRTKRIDVEVWFVALGAELAGNGGMKAFMEAHAAELKGSIVIELQGLGAGELSLIEKEGTYLSKKASSRMKRLVKKAGKTVGLDVPSATMEWTDSAAAYALKHGQQSMHLVGMADKKPAFYAEPDDVVENIDNDQLALNTDFIMELLRDV